MKKICFVNMNAYSLFNPNSNAPIGGAEVDLYTLANYLKKYFQIDFIVGDWGQEKVEVHQGIKVYKSIKLQKTVWNYLKAPFLLWHNLQVSGADVYLMESAGIEVGIVAVFCKIYRKKFLYRTAHDIDCNREFIKENKIAGYFYKYGLEGADSVTTQNKDNQKMLWENHKIKAKILKNAYQIDNLATKNYDKNYILWVARCSKWKRPELFLRIVKKFPEEKFVMISPMVSDERDLFNQIKQGASQLTNLVFIERVSFFEIQKYFNKAKIFLGTSDYEGFPNTYLQACLGGTPIISLRVNPDNFITENNLGYCANGKLDLMLDKINYILNHPDDWLEKSRNALKYVKKNHNINIIGKKWRAILEKLTDN